MADAVRSSTGRSVKAIVVNKTMAVGVDFGFQKLEESDLPRFLKDFFRKVLTDKALQEDLKAAGVKHVPRILGEALDDLLSSMKERVINAFKSAKDRLKYIAERISEKVCQLMIKNW